ncbi:sodium:solute symporter family protein [Pseudobacteriovorax antillogorgiicola]|uniref:Solute:Na+ symporter, SSS family n=1 Tax=Pseudobacteriovorax antillogorgiicola TaxID=1513793 RepID=A0A1Y6BHL8_9BACT|nr:sodium:solute symporter family protein [Pseudobacteriovorax antillogorgiicola]TCS55583.1 SSS family solute:Na+ symporter [Pseudobacteriovorax antillogorgiicola]SMF10628.1 solute:Na+ symporter, SSS family [Pseudobacteriovorax antillogorgiicola]
MSSLDIGILVIYLLIMLAVGVYFLTKNDELDDYYVGGRSMGSLHIGLSVVATDVGGGFSIGLGGLGFAMGISGSWMLFTGLLGAWISAVILIPKIKVLENQKKLLTFPQIFDHFFGPKVALIAAIITTLGYIGFTSSQLLAGAKLASATFDGLSLNAALIAMGVIAVVYTAIGGIKAVIYTDTVQWIILMAGLILVAIPCAHISLGGFEALKTYLPSGHLSWTNLSWQQFFNWAITIIPIWFIGMTLYQRIYACADVKTAKRAWFFAGLLEFPIMALMGVLLGMYSRVALESGVFAELGYAAGSALDSELGMPLLLKTVLPTGLIGLVLAAYFSAILSTADSCLMAASGSFVSDIVKPSSTKGHLKFSQVATLILGIVALFLAGMFENVLSLMLYSYSFMVSGLLVPLMGALFFKKTNPLAAGLSMIIGGVVTVSLSLLQVGIPFGLDGNFFGILCAVIVFVTTTTFAGRTHAST